LDIYAQGISKTAKRLLGPRADEEIRHENCDILLLFRAWSAALLGCLVPSGSESTRSRAVFQRRFFFFGTATSFIVEIEDGKLRLRN